MHYVLNYAKFVINNILVKIKSCISNNKYTIFKNEHEVLYVFAPQVQLFNVDGKEELVNVYIKFNLIELSNGNRVVVISFHKLNKLIDYLFR